MIKHNTLNFGKYKGRTIRDIWIGKTFMDDSTVIKNYLQELFDFLAGKRLKGSKIASSSADISDCSKEFDYVIGDEREFNVFVTREFLIIEGENKKVEASLNIIIHSLLRGDYLNQLQNGYWIHPESKDNDKLKYTPASIEFLNLNSDIDYLKWCIKTIDNFYVNSNELNELIKLKPRILDSIFLKNIKPNIIEYKPLFKNYDYSKLNEFIAENRSKKNSDSLNIESYEDNFYMKSYESKFCNACQESPCMCSDPERTSTTYHY